MASESETIGVVGVGWVGLVTAACFAELGHEVRAMDVDEAKVEALRRGEVPIHEPGLPELVRKNAERLHFTTTMDDVLDAARLLFVCVDTPPTYSGDADLSRVRTVVDGLPAEGEFALVMKSTVPAGTGASIKRDVPGLAYVSCPEFLKEGTAVEDFMHPDRVVVGADPGDEWAAVAVAAAYEPLGGELVRTDVASAEMIKLASNAFLATKISFINEIANVSELVGADVTEVARGMGLDRRIGPSFLGAGVGYGGSCLIGEETVMVRWDGVTSMVSLGDLFERFSSAMPTEQDGLEVEALRPDGLEVLSWDPDDDVPSYRPVSALTRRRHKGEVVEVRTKMGRRLRCTPDHPFVVADADGDCLETKLAEGLTRDDWLPLAQGPGKGVPVEPPGVLSGRVAAGLTREQVIVRPAPDQVASVAAMSPAQRRAAVSHPRGLHHLYDAVRTGTFRLHECESLGLSLVDAAAGTAKNGTYVPISIPADERFWRIVGLYIAEGHMAVDGKRGPRHRLTWSFHPTDEGDLVDEVAEFWRALGLKVRVWDGTTAANVTVSTRLLAGWWVDVLGLGRNCYEQRIPDLIWDAPESHKKSLLAGLWRGGGSWSFVSRGPSVTLDFGTASRELADGVLRLLSDIEIVARLHVGRTNKSTVDNYWITISGADQVERSLFLVAESDRPQIRESLSRQAKRIAPTGYRRHGGRTAMVRVASIDRLDFDDYVYSLEVPGPETFVTSGSVVVHNCFPKDTQALKQLAGNTGYHFQLLTAVIEVNKLQKRRVIGKLEKHLGSLADKTIALLGLAFKPDTDDMREASSLVVAARLQGEGASVRAYDPVAEDAARELLPGVELAESAERALDGADAAVLVTEWPEFAELDWNELRGRMANPLIVDGRNFLDAAALRDAGFTYEGIGRPSGGAGRKI